MATYLDEASPADSDPITLGAGAIRTFKQEMDALIDQVWATTGLFNAGWITAPGANITGSGSMYAPGAIQTADIAPLAITTALLDTNAVGPSQINPTAITTALLAAASAISQLTVPTASVNTAAIAGAAVGTNQIAPNAITAALLASGLVKGIAVGTYAGAATGSPTVSSLPFAPKVLFFVDTTHSGIGMAFFSEVSGGASPIHEGWNPDTTTAGVPVNTVQWTSDGFTIVTPATHFAFNGHTYTFLAIAF